MANLLIEIGCEPIPARFVRDAAEGLKKGLERILEESRLDHDGFHLYYTPRRLAVLITGLPRRQRDHKVKIQGPPEKVAFEDGRPTRLLLGFLRSKKAGLEDVVVETTEKGRYVQVLVTRKGKPVPELIGDSLAEILAQIEFPKPMVWDETGFRFIRPIRWLVFLFGAKRIPIRLAGITATNRSRGRLTDPGWLIIRRPEEYESVMRKAGIIVDPGKRMDRIERLINSSARRLGARPIIDPEHLVELTGMVESPLIGVGSFDREYLKLPEPILIRIIRDLMHAIPLKQKGRLYHHYLIPLDADRKARKNAVSGYDRVLEARLADARFYYEQDLKTGLEAMVRAEGSVTWLEGKGTLREKTDRLERITAWLARKVGADPGVALRAAHLAKADLLSALIREKDFTPLEGIAGSFYARAEGEEKEVWQAIGEQYRPRFAGDQIPRTTTGALLSIADKLDNIHAGFAIGRIPSGSLDPLGLRRQAYGIIQIMVEHRFSIPITELIGHLLSYYPELSERMDELKGFFSERLNRYLIDRGLPYDLVAAVLDVCDDPFDAWLRVRSLVEFRRRPEFETLVIGQKRLANILKGVETIGKVEPARFESDAETRLFQLARKTEAKIDKLWPSRNYSGILNLLLSMRKTIDRFFDQVLVMHEDEKLRANRIALVAYVRDLFHRFANFSLIVLEKDAQG
ncbi:glycine--tRNA ligase subunit beta [candidate division WOR-3 bacterium]|uniref:Glycine--tRNA ligase beta subunit n=1 Tax=candidate division WOR-3 bacterium TaxID=2052148 RepID=A0A660SJC7_UNCW3|nr:MAG: glycine--tRNA ligase subunit beta [candidate division WOR-3 bacterium]